MHSLRYWSKMLTLIFQSFSGTLGRIVKSITPCFLRRTALCLGGMDDFGLTKMDFLLRSWWPSCFRRHAGSRWSPKRDSLLEKLCTSRMPMGATTTKKMRKDEDDVVQSQTTTLQGRGTVMILVTTTAFSRHIGNKKPKECSRTNWWLHEDARLKEGGVNKINHRLQGATLFGHQSVFLIMVRPDTFLVIEIFDSAGTNEISEYPKKSSKYEWESTLNRWRYGLYYDEWSAF